MPDNASSVDAEDDAGARSLLLSHSSPPVPPQQETPLPTRELAVLWFARLCEPINFSVIFPFINEMVLDVGATDDKAKVGFYAGMVESLFAFAQTCTILYWGSLSDRIGRRPVLIFGLCGVTISALLFGLARSFLAMLMARVLLGCLNGNVAIVKSVVGEITDETNQARAFSFLPLAWTIGCFIGPLLGGYLSRPVEQYPDVFGPGSLLHFGGLWGTFPYFLPCLASALIAVASLMLAILHLEETLPELVEKKHRQQPVMNPSLAEPGRPIGYGSTSDSSPPSTRHQRSSSAISVQSWNSGFSPPLSIDATGAARDIRSHDSDRNGSSTGVMELLRIRQIQNVLFSYAFLSLTAVALDAVLVLYLYEPVSLGGLGFSSSSTGIVLSMTGLGGVAVQLLLFPPLQRRMGSLRLYQYSFWAFPLSVLLLPIANLIARAGLVETTETGGEVITQAALVAVWACILVSTLLKVVGQMAFSTNMILVNQCATLTPGTALGTLNSLAQMSSSVSRAIGPYAANTLFALSVTHNLLGGHFVYLVLTIISIVGALTCLLIKDMDV